MKWFLWSFIFIACVEIIGNIITISDKDSKRPGEGCLSAIMLMVWTLMLGWAIQILHLVPQGL